jgi:hypothetical protein
MLSGGPDRFELKLSDVERAELAVWAHSRSLSVFGA